MKSLDVKVEVGKHSAVRLANVPRIPNVGLAFWTPKSIQQF